MKIFRTRVHGHYIEIRYGDFGGQAVIVNSELVSRKPFAGWTSGASHFFEVKDEQGRSRRVEVSIVAPTLGIGQTRFAVSVDGVQRALLEPCDPRTKPTVCPNCGYELRGQTVENGEVRCPECGRHTSAGILALDQLSEDRPD